MSITPLPGTFAPQDPLLFQVGGDVEGVRALADLLSPASPASSICLNHSLLCNTHKLKMQMQLAVHLEQMGLAQSIQVEFIYLPSYSPKLNLVEYVIHLLRLRFLHHLPLGTMLTQIEQQLSQFFDTHQFLSAE